MFCCIHQIQTVLDAIVLQTGVTIYCNAFLYRSVKRETLKLIETFLDKAEDQSHIGKQFVPPMMESVLCDYARNVPDARESEVLSLFATIINKYASYWLMRAVVIKDVYHLRNSGLLQDLIPNVTLLLRYKATMLDDVPNIFEAVFQCTLEVIGLFLCYSHYSLF